REPAARVLYTNTAKLPERQNIIEKNLGLAAAALGIDAAKLPLDFGITPSESDIREAKGAVESFGGPFVLLNPAGGWVTKLWHAEKYGQLADRIAEELGLVPVISAGPGDAELVERAVAASMSGKLKTIELSLKAFYETARHAEAYVGGDTGPTHIAAAAGTPVVGIFGPTEWWRNGTLNPDDICVERKDIDCRVDCHRRTCGNWICMDITVDTVFTELRRRLATQSG
ncbi:MAG TPA: glycosyltransferase family 9 protein, partial [Pyrinomonadaceae bacterium]|nr:glycosyltransferase family 9 protein [Pyrinomonadaceae bacterium]